MKFSAKDRTHYIQRMQKETFDLAIIGGGITGAGIARDAASRGMKVALIEGSDFSSGTSSRSSKLIHGGIRYLENLEFKLVFEALSERRILFDLAPHLVHPLRFVLPIYKHSRVGMFKMGLGMMLYDCLSLFDAPEMHESLSPAESLERVPSLNGQDLSGSYVYSDAYMDDDRLTIETLRSAAHHGALCVNYMHATGALWHEDKIVGIKCLDKLGKQEISITAKHIVSSVGPWTDDLAKTLFDTWKPVLRPTKGIHLCFPKNRIQLEDAVVMAVDKEKRIIFMIPRHDMIILGTTDTDFNDDPSKVRVTKEDVDYLLRVANEYFPTAKLTINDIISAYAGVRPLVHDGSESEGKTSREHVIINDPRNVTFVAGGKYTTYRKMAEDAVKSIIKQFPLEEQMRYQHSRTLEALNPHCSPENYSRASLQSQALEKNSRLDPSDIQLLIFRHGMEALSLIRDNPQSTLWSLEAKHAIEQTMCLNLTDFYFRRSPLFLAQPDHGLTHIEEIIGEFAQYFSWTDEQKKLEIQKLHQTISDELKWVSN